MLLPSPHMLRYIKTKPTNKPQDSNYKEICGENRCYYIALYLIEATKEAWLLQTCKTKKIAIDCKFASTYISRLIWNEVNLSLSSYVFH